MSPFILLSKNITFFLKKKNFKESETESKIDNPTRSFRETNLVLQLI